MLSIFAVPTSNNHTMQPKAILPAYLVDKVLETSDDLYTNRSAYCRILQVHYPQNSQLFLLIWKWKDPKRIRWLLWKLVHKVLTNVERARRRIAENDLCRHCNNSPESQSHTFRDCSSILKDLNCFRLL